MDENDPRHLGPALRAVRDDCGMTAKDLAERTGISASYISEIETGKRAFTQTFCEKAALALDMKPEDLVRKMRGNYSAAVKRTLPGYAQQAWQRPVLSDDVVSDRAPPVERSGHDYESLCAYLIEVLGKESAWEHVSILTTMARAGNSLASRRAQALLELLSKPGQ